MMQILYHDPLESNHNNSTSRRISLSFPQAAGILSLILLLVVTYVTHVDTDDSHKHPPTHAIVSKQGRSDTLLHASSTTTSTSSTTTKITTHQPTKKYHHNHDDNSTGIAWLMSFPNSGTSFTSKLIRHVTQSSTASNYGEELPNMDPVFRNTGPFWIDPQSLLNNYTRPTSLVFTKTHCGGRCELCGPSVSIESPQSFLVQCLSGHNPNGRAVRYDLDKVRKALHLIRNPFDNIVSRFHLELHSFARDKSKQQVYTKDRNGFRSFCKTVMDDPHAHEFRTSRFIDPEAFAMLDKVPCHADFMRYMAWHNLAHIVTNHHLGIPTLVVHYEDYETDLDGTTRDILDFLELPQRGNAIPFVAGKQYAKEYFTKEEREAVRVASERLSLMETWAQLKHYFEE